MLHSRKSGILRSIDLHRDLAPYLLMHEPYAGPGAAVNAFAKAGDALGALLFQFDSRARMETVLAHMDELCTVEVEAAS